MRFEVERRTRRIARNLLYSAGLLDLPKLDLSDVDTVIVSYPKCGRTWLRALIGEAIISAYDLPGTNLFDTLALTKAAGLRPTLFTHDGTGFPPETSYRKLTADKSAFRDKAVVFLYRDPRDVLVSAWFQAVKRSNSFDGSMSQFVRDPCLGIRKIARFYRIWEDASAIPRAFHFMDYKALRADPGAQLVTLLPMIGMQIPEPRAIEAVVEACSFEKMRALESSGVYARAGSIMSPVRSGDPDTYKVRSGRVGEHKQHLSRDDLDYIDQVLAEERHPFSSLTGEAVARGGDKGVPGSAQAG